MNNEDVLSAFEVWLQPQPLPVGIATVPDVLSAIREFAKAIDPVPLDEATTKKMNAFQYSYKAPAADARLRGVVAAMAKVEEAIAEVRYHQIKYAMLMFRNFRDSVLKNQSKEKTQ